MIGETTADKSISTDEDALEGLAELEIEDGVNDGIDERVDVAQPSGELEGRPARLAVALELGANGVQDVAREERDPANQEHSLMFSFPFSNENTNRRAKT